MLSFLVCVIVFLLFTPHTPFRAVSSSHHLLTSLLYHLWCYLFVVLLHPSIHVSHTHIAWIFILGLSLLIYFGVSLSLSLFSRLHVRPPVMIFFHPYITAVQSPGFPPSHSHSSTNHCIRCFSFLVFSLVCCFRMLRLFIAQTTTCFFGQRNSSRKQRGTMFWAAPLCLRKKN